MYSNLRTFRISNALLGSVDDYLPDVADEPDDVVFVSDRQRSSTLLTPRDAPADQNTHRPRSVPSSPSRIAADKALGHVEQQFETTSAEAGNKDASHVADQLRSRTNTSSGGVAIAGTQTVAPESRPNGDRRQGNASANTGSNLSSNPKCENQLLRGYLDHERDILESENWSDDENKNEAFQFTIAPTLDERRISLTRRPTDRGNNNQSDTITTEQRIDPDIIVSIDGLDTSHLPDTLIVELPARGPIDLATIYDTNAKQAKEEDKNNILLSYINASVNKEAEAAIQTWTDNVKALTRQTYGMSLQDSMREIEASVNFDTEAFVAARNKRLEEANRTFDTAIDRMSTETTQMITWRYECHTDHVIKRCDLMTASDINPASVSQGKE